MEMEMNDLAESGKFPSKSLNNENIDDGQDVEVSTDEFKSANEFNLQEQISETSLMNESSSGGLEKPVVVIHKEELTNIESEPDMKDEKVEREETLMPIKPNGDLQLAINGGTESNCQKNIESENGLLTDKNSRPLKSVKKLQRQLDSLWEKFNNLKENFAIMESELEMTSVQVKELLENEIPNRPDLEYDVQEQKTELLSSEAESVSKPQYKTEQEYNKESQGGYDSKIDYIYNTPILDKQLEEEQLRLLLGAIAQEAHQQAVNGFIKDQHELEVYQVNALEWAKKGENIQEKLSEMVRRCDDILQQAKIACNHILNQADTERLKELFMGRQEGIELIVNRMISRLPERASSLAEDKPLETNLPQMDLKDWHELLNGINSIEDAKRKSAFMQKQLGIERYRLLASWREESDKKRKTILSFIERQVLPVFDGIRDGERHSEPIILQIQESANSQGKELPTGLIQWFATYKALREEGLKILDNVDVRCIDVKRGDKMDYERHEPFDVEQDMALDNEHIKEVIRDGFEYWMEEDKRYRVLRPAQVIVVKN